MFSIHYKEKKPRETSSRSRGFKFALIGGVVAYLTDAREIVVPESGQGIFGPAIIKVGHRYPDYRNHPLFTQRMTAFLNAIFGMRIQFVFPRIWDTKGATLREYVALSGGREWESTRSCWRGSRWSSVGGKLRQCGVCAACILRRLSVHTAGFTEQPDTYVCTDMSAETLEAAVEPSFTKLTPAYRQYALAGVLHLDHLADLADLDSRPIVRRHAGLLSPILGLSTKDVEKRLIALLSQHKAEWKHYVNSLGTNSFINNWIRAS